MPHQPIEIPEPLAPFEPGEEERISIQVDDPFAAEVDAADLAEVIAVALASEGRADARGDPGHHR